MGALSRQIERNARWLWLFCPEDTTIGSGYKNRAKTGTNMAGCLKSGIWIAISILVSLVIGQL